MNLYVYESTDSALVVDCGIKFANPEFLGIDNIQPDLSYLYSIKKKIKGIVFTHGHEDHIGNAPELFANFDVPVYTGRFTAELLHNKAGVDKNINVISTGDELFLGSIGVEVFSVPHSIPDTFGIWIKYGSFSAVHISDFCTDYGSISFLPEFGNVTALLLDSTNAVSRRTTHSGEVEITKELARLTSECDGAVFFTTFASNVQRIAGAMKAAVSCGRKVVVEGASADKTVQIASRLGIMPAIELVNAKKACYLPRNELFYILSGCQGEYSSALYSVAAGERKVIKPERNDMLIFSSRVIPGNEDNINKIINNMLKLGVRVVRPSDAMVHVSGHIYPEELVGVIDKIAPMYYIPIHGEYQHLAAAVENAALAGVDKEYSIFIETGEQLVFEGETYSKKSPVDAKPKYYDSRGGFFVSDEELSARRQLSKDGMVVAILGADGEFYIDGYGFSVNADSVRFISNMFKEEERLDCEAEAQCLQRVIKRYFRKYMGRRPVVAVYKEVV